HDPAAADGRGGLDHCLFAHGDFRTVATEQAEPRPAERTGIRLGMKAPVRRVLVFGAAGRAHREAAHRRARAVVGQGFDDRVARAALRAVDERIAETAVRRLVEFAEALLAGGEVGDEAGSAAGVRQTRHDREARVAGRRDVLGYYLLDARIGRRRNAQARLEAGNRGGRALGLQRDAAAGICDPAGEIAGGRLAIDERAEADALDGAANGQADAFPRHNLAGRETARRHVSTSTAVTTTSSARGSPGSSEAMQSSSAPA